MLKELDFADLPQGRHKTLRTSTGEYVNVDLDSVVKVETTVITDDGERIHLSTSPQEINDILRRRNIERAAELRRSKNG